jgi:hypothetical protein
MAVATPDSLKLLVFWLLLVVLFVVMEIGSLALVSLFR